MQNVQNNGRFRRYRPSNGTEGEIFMNEWCALCSLNGEDDPCEIQLRALAFCVEDDEYPDEWSYKDNGHPRCTAFCADGALPYRCPETRDFFDT